jgi:hypothetical protein
VEAHAAELTMLREDLDLETRSYTEYHQTVRRRLCKLHEMVVMVEEMIDSVVGEVKVVPDTLWRLNDNFAVLGIKGILNMLNSEGCEELGRLHDLDASCGTSALEDVPNDVHKLAA